MSAEITREEMPAEITRDEMMELVEFFRDINGDVKIGNVEGNINGNVYGNVYGTQGD